MANQLTGHWTNRNTEDFVYRIGFDFVTQLEKFMKSGDGVGRGELAKRLGISKGRVSQVLNNPGNLRLETIVEFALSLGLKVSIVAYDDGDPANENGPVNSEIFAQCWNNCGNPTEFSADTWIDFESTVSWRYSTNRYLQTAEWVNDWAGEGHERHSSDMEVPPELRDLSKKLGPAVEAMTDA